MKTKTTDKSSSVNSASGLAVELVSGFDWGNSMNDEEKD
jgi:hypothetical protein